MNTLKYLLTIFCFLITFQNYGQNQLKISGKVVDEKSKSPIEFATVAILKSTTSEAITGNTTSTNGTFSFNIKNQNFYIQISFIGYKTLNIKEFSINNNVLNLGTISLTENAESLNTVVVRAEKSTTEFKLDKRVFNVGKDLSSTGASALEILNNVPSVNVDIEGEISLRGSSGVQVLINGKPSVLTSTEGNALGSITADMISSVEVITNPSAKYDAEGTTGIINIILNKNDKKGLNGAVSLNVGTPTNQSIGLSLNKRTEKFNLFSQFGIGKRIFPRDSYTETNDLIEETTLITASENDKQEKFYNIVLGTDYYINKNNVLTLSGHYAFEKEDEDSHLIYNYSKPSTSSSSEWTRDEDTKADNPKYEYELQYKKDFNRHKKQELLFSALGSFFGKDKLSNFTNSNSNSEQNETDFKRAEYTFKLDYVHPINNTFTIETGSQYLINNVTNDYVIRDLIDNVWVKDNYLSNVFEYKQNVLAGYVTTAYENDFWGLKIGLRTENTNISTLLENTNQENKQNYTDFFPSAHTSYNLSKKVSVQAGYSKRIYRPRMRNLNPFFSIRDSYNQTVGNSNLQPEYSDSYEITSIYKFNKINFNLGLYYIYTTDVIERITTYENQIQTRMPENIGTKKSTGIELNGKYTPTKWLNFNADLNYGFYKRDGEFEGESFDFETNSWRSKFTTKIKLPRDLDIEITNQYNSGFETIQGEIASNYYANLGIRKKIAKGKIILNLSIRDLFESREYESTIIQTDYNTFSKSSRGRFVVFGISYGFGKGEAMEFGGHKRF
ncbi:outer membrane beta-barrel family protein [Lutibacter sp. TH_r2]|uniref:outer membrane beta-barrel family protein n=1 Tax=Lutibacter sp. TH_r2 TaxID=3082083 RepID=UPI002953E299|nr:outer membrane beta-barrel family protein [Lutibacter sp. TH_r2]MDV7187330.1 outer membrane beta-barrel family protein [Lutibacter sp. TH_r2]